MNNKVTFVTCIYDDLYGSELGGRSNPTRKYYYGVESALKMDSPYVIFCWPKDVEKLEKFFTDFLGHEEFQKRIRVIGYDLYKTDLREIIKREKVKNTNIPADRCHDVMFGKFSMVLKVIEENFFGSEYFFWIDAGLSSSSLFPNKHLDLSIPEKRYNSCHLFTPKVVDSLISNSSDKVLFLKLNTVGYQFNKKHLPPDHGPWYIIGGLFGGKKDQMINLCKSVLDSFLFHISVHDTLYFEEQIMTILYSFNRGDYNVIEFDTWYHEDCGDWVQERIKGKKNFYKIFEDFNL